MMAAAEMQRDLFMSFRSKGEVASYLQPFRTINWHFQDQCPVKQRIYSNCSEIEATIISEVPWSQDSLKGPLP